MPDTPLHGEFRRVKDIPASIASHELDLQNAFEWLDALERRVAKIEAFTDMILHIRADVAAIAAGIDPTLGQRVAYHDTAIDSLTDAIEQHRLLLARLLEKEAGQ